MSQPDQPASPGRKPSLDDAKRREVCAILSVGGTRTMAAHYVGCAVSTIRRTARRDPQFAEQLRKAEVNSEILYLRSIQTASQDGKQWRAAAWALERLFPERYGRRHPRTITRAQLVELLRQLGAVVIREIPSKVDRQRVLARLKQLARAARRRGTKRAPR